MSSKKYTSQGLPIVTKQTINSYVEESDRDARKEEFRDISSIIRKENLELCEYIDSLLEGCMQEGEADFAGGIVIGASLVYETLRRQAETNKLEESLNNH